MDRSHGEFWGGLNFDAFSESALLQQLHDGILNKLPDLLPMPLTPENLFFRRTFYARWGKENAVVLGAASRARNI